MSDNSTHFFHVQPSFNACCSDSVVKQHNFASGRVNLFLLILIAALLPVAVVANGLVLAAIWRKPSLRTPSYILLAGLAFTDFCTGLISQLLWTVNEVSRYLDPDQFNLSDKSKWPKFYSITSSIGDGCAKYFYQVTVLLITVMSIERWLHMTSQSGLTVRRVSFIAVILALLMLPLLVFPYERGSNFIIILLVPCCIIITSVAYFKVFRIIRRHQLQIEANAMSQNHVQPVINFVKYKKSVFTILIILVVFYITYLPVIITISLLWVVLQNPNLKQLILHVSILLGYLSCSLNPLILMWRMKDIRDEIMKLLKGMFCRSS